MANNKTTVTQQDEVKELVADARFITRSYKNKDGEDKEYVAFEFVDPFHDEDFRDVALKAKWDKYDEKTNRLVRPDRVFGWMTFYARKALRQAAEVRVKVTIKPVTYKSKRTGQMVTYPSIFAQPTFLPLEDERPVEVVVKDANRYNDFLLLAGQALGIKFAPKEPVDEDYGL